MLVRRPHRMVMALLVAGFAITVTPERARTQCYGCATGGTYGLSTYCESGGTNGGTRCLEVSSGATTDCYLGGDLCNVRLPAQPLASNIFPSGPGLLAEGPAVSDPLAPASTSIVGVYFSVSFCPAGGERGVRGRQANHPVPGSAAERADPRAARARASRKE